MSFSLQIKSHTTVTPEYSWDTGVPCVSNTIYNNIDTSYITGYAPYMCVLFQVGGQTYTQSASTTQVLDTYVEIDFDDSYNSSQAKSSFALSEADQITHTFVMPGSYKISYIAREIFKVFPGDVSDGRYDVCREDSRVWGWNDMTSGKENDTTWFENTKEYSISTPKAFVKTWISPEQCLDAYCKIWSWDFLNSLSDTPLRWSDTSYGALYAKTWAPQGHDDCKLTTYSYILSTIYTQVTRHDCIVYVKEIAPTANIFCRTITSKTSPLTAIFSAEGCVAGSFPIEKIIWDFNDGSDLLTVSRFNPNNIDLYTYNSSFSTDTQDPRNFDVTHVYNVSSVSTLYPSLTVVSCNTHSSDYSSTVIDSISAKTLHQGTFSLLKSRAINDVILYASSIDKHAVFHTFDLNSEYISEVQVSNTPPNIIKNFKGKLINSVGFNGEDFDTYIGNNLIKNQQRESIVTDYDSSLLTQTQDNIRV